MVGSMAVTKKKPAPQKKVRDDADVPQLKLKEIDEVAAITLTDYAGPFGSSEHPEYGESYLLNILRDGKKMKLFLNEKTAAGKAFVKAMDSGKLSEVDMGGTLELILRPRLVVSENGEENTMVQLRFGKASGKTVSDDQAEIPF
jgi:hypothetical protein